MISVAGDFVSIISRKTGSIIGIGSIWPIEAQRIGQIGDGVVCGNCRKQLGIGVRAEARWQPAGVVSRLLVIQA